MSEDDITDNIVNEPSVPYGNNHVRIYSSLEQASFFEAKEVSMQSPIERIQETVALILRVYGTSEEELRKRIRSNHITILDGK